MQLQLGEVLAIIISSPKVAKEVLKTHDAAFANRPVLLAIEVISYDNSGMIFAPYDEYWRQMRKLCVMQFLSAKRIQSLRSIREEEVWNLIEGISSSAGLQINFTEKISSSTYGITARAAIGKKCKYEEELISLIKETFILIGGFEDIFSGASETSATMIEWAMSELLRNPKVMEKTQAEVRQALKGRKNIDEVDIQKLDYLKLVVKETLRLHPPAALIPRESREKCEINGYEIPNNTKVYINAWAIGRDTEYWSDADCFHPERFQGSHIDFRGANFEFIPFGGGRRICPGISFALAIIFRTILQQVGLKILEIGLVGLDLDSGSAKS
ncbi:germacrene a oxidase [Quercus suber]|uniref:Germacrene a oxidase n=1 Tax=Quercus suber TaxID=58331 RepID=A0AAW0LUR0_QUESU